MEKITFDSDFEVFYSCICDEFGCVIFIAKLRLLSLGNKNPKLKNFKNQNGILKKKKRLIIGTKELCWAHQHRPIYNLRASTSFISESVQVSTTFKAKQGSRFLE